MDHSHASIRTDAGALFGMLIVDSSLAPAVAEGASSRRVPRHRGPVRLTESHEPFIHVGSIRW